MTQHCVLRVLDQQPKTLDDTLSIVVRMESYSGDSHADSSDDIADHKRVRVVSPARESETDKRVRKLEELVQRQDQEIVRLKGQANNAPCVYPQNGGNDMSWNLDGPSQIPPMVTQPERTAAVAPGIPRQQAPTSGMQRGRRSGRQQQNNRLPRDVCSRCLQRGHWARNCTVPSYRPSGSGQYGPQHTPPIVNNGNVQYDNPYYGPPSGGNFVASQTYGSPQYDTPTSSTYGMPPSPEYGSLHFNSPNVGIYGLPPGYAYGSPSCVPVPPNNFVSGDSFSGGTHAGPAQSSGGSVHLMSDSGRSETYVDINIKGRPVFALLDSGCERSVCPYRVCRNVKITPVKVELYAANATPISVVGTARLQFTVCGMKMFADVYVSESVDEIILGYDFLESNKCEWLFGEIVSSLTVCLCHCVVDHQSVLCVAYMCVSLLWCPQTPV